MVVLFFAVLINLAAPAAAQNTLQLPDVTLFGEYTLYLAAPVPKGQEIPAAAGMPDHRLSYPRSLYRVDPAVPDPPRVYWQSIPGSALAAPGLLHVPIDGDANADSGVQQPASSTSWQAGIDYIPGAAVVSRFEAARSSGVWDLSTDLNLDLADGWVTSPPEAPTVFTVGVQTRRRAEALNIDARFAAGAFYVTDASAVFTLEAVAGVFGELGVLHWREETQLYGISAGSPPADADAQRGAVQQDLQLALLGSALDLSLQATGTLAAGLPSPDTETHGLMILELGWHNSAWILHMWAGGAVLYYRDTLSFYPSAGLELYPTDTVSLALRGAPFLRLPAEGQGFRAVQAVQAVSELPQLESEGGYSLLSELRFDPLGAFDAVFSFEWRKGWIYLLNASDLELRFIDTNQGVLGGDLIWQIRAGRPGIRLNLSAELAVPFPLTARPWEEPLYGHAGLVWTTDFHKVPVEFIIKALIGDYADDGSQPFVFTDWEIFSGLTASIEGNWKIGTYGTVHTGFEAFLTPNFTFRFLIGYGLRR